MNRFNKVFLAAALAAAFAVNAGAALVPADKACEALKAQAQQLLGQDALRCQPGDALTVTGSSDSLLKARQGLFPQDSFAGYQVLWQQAAGSAQMASAIAPILEKTQGAVVGALTNVNFDGSAARAGSSALLSVSEIGLSGPPGSRPACSGPPGSCSGQSGPPGSPSGPYNPNPPSHRPPPSRPAPVWRSVPPPPSWWNTYEVTTWWNAPLYDYGSDSFTISPYDPNSGSYVSRWSSWPQTFVSTGRTTDSRSFERDKENQSRSFSAQLRSDLVQTIKQCYYRAHVNYTWVDGGYYGSHWDEHFQYYEAACYRYNQTLDTRTRAIVVRFSMGEGKSLLPWEHERLNVSYNGNDVRWNVDNPAFQYSEAQNDGHRIVIAAGEKNRTAADRSAVHAELVEEDGKLMIAVTDDQAGFYDGETLEVAANVMALKSGWFGIRTWSGVMNRDENNPFKITIKGSQRRYLLEVEGDMPKDRTEYALHSWNFRRAESALTDGNWVNNLGEGNHLQH